MKILVILMTYGSPKTLSSVPQYLKNVYGGKDADAETIKEFKRRYKLIGGSPLIKITKQQAKALEKELNKASLMSFLRKQGSNKKILDQARNDKDRKIKFVVQAGMRFSDPFIEDVIKTKAINADIIVGVIMSPQYSPIIMSGYIKELKQAVDKLRRKKIKLLMATDWHLQPYFIEALAERVTESLKKLPKNVKEIVPVLFSAHSMPKRVIDKEPNYINDLKETAAAVSKRVGLSKKRWMFCYQSAGHTPEEWLKPDFEDIMPELKAKGQTHVLIAPVQFLADHLEILYDVGIGAREQAEENGIHFERTESLNTSPSFIKALAEVVKATIKDNI